MNHCKGKTVLPRWPQFCFLFPWLSQKAFLLLACCCCCEPRNRFSHFPHVHQFLSETPVLFCKASAHVVLPNCLHNYFLLAKSGDCTIVAIQSMRCSSYSDYHFPKNGPILASILFIFVISSLQFQSYKLKKRRWLLFLVFKPGSAGW